MGSKSSIAVVVLLLLTHIVSACTVGPTEVTRVVKETVIEKETVFVEREVPVTATPAPSPAPPAEPQQGGTLSIHVPSFRMSLSWPHSRSFTARVALQPMRENLFRVTTDGAIEPWLGIGVDISADGLVYTYHLRDDVQWHDGEPLTADDFKFGVELRTSPEMQPPGGQWRACPVKGYWEYMMGEADEITGVRVVDDHTLQIVLDKPDAEEKCMAENAELGPTPRHAIEELDWGQVLDGSAAYWTTKPIGTGPYEFVRYEPDQYIEYARNDGYWGGDVGPEKLLVRFAPTDVAIVMLQKGELDFVSSLPPPDAERLQVDPNLDVLAADNRAQWYGLEVNPYTLDGLWRDPRAKQAFLYSIDRQDYVDTALHGFGTVRHSLYDGTQYACPTMTEYDYDPQKADALWNEIGLDREVREEIVIDLMSWSSGLFEGRRDFYPIAADYLRQMGFKVNVDLTDDAFIWDYINGEGPRGKDWDYHDLMFGPRDALAPFVTPGSLNNFGHRNWPFRGDPETYVKPNAWYYENPRMTKLLALLESEADEDKRTAYFQEIDCIWNEELPALPTAAPSWLAAKSKRLQGVAWEKYADAAWFAGFEDWWVWEP